MNAILQSAILKRAAPAESVECGGCDRQCIADVEIIPAGDGIPARAYVNCEYDEEIGRVKVPLEQLDVWNASHRDLAHCLCGLLGIEGVIEECIPGRLWWLGRLKANSTKADLFLARGATWSDAREVFSNCSHPAGCSKPLVFVLRDIPQDKLFGPSAQVASLSRLLAVENSSLVFDRGEISDLLRLPRIISTIPKAIFEVTTLEYRHIRYHGEMLRRLSPKQAVIVRQLHEAYERGVPEVAWGAFVFPEDMGFPGKMTDIFRPDDTHGRNILVVEVSPGVYRLNV